MSDEVEVVDSEISSEIPENDSSASGDPIESEPIQTERTGDVTRAHLKGLIEALVFVADHPVTVAELAKSAKADRKLVKQLADELRDEYAERGIHFDEVSAGYTFRTSTAYAGFVRDVVVQRPVRMTRAQMETLAIIAYRQPLTRPEVDEVRGVDSGGSLKMLLERDLVKILGRKDEPGRPLLYGTTPTFLEFFGLRSIRDLPPLREFTELSDDSRRVYEEQMEGDGATLTIDPAAPDAADRLATAASFAESGEGAPLDSPSAQPDSDPGPDPEPDPEPGPDPEPEATA